jgi:hypothetical protein
MPTSRKLVAFRLVRLGFLAAPFIYIALVLTTQDLLTSTAATLAASTGLGIAWRRLMRK